MGVTKKSRITYENPDGVGPQKVVLQRTRQTRQEIEKERQRERDLLAALPNEARDELLQHELSANPRTDDQWFDEDDRDDVLLSALGQAAPGTEGELLSGAGAEGTFFDLAHSLWKRPVYLE
ncbi:hypothetical protein FISHEDRAFT_74954 [Fistulina hepatica ATCC 64428]|uniref:Uncharacterized protein n=1 Tax=Fistulina hepatica ATCC 64428 TaxID=1128425 RepID=A0A0D7A9Q9_9AGAR|nr:hypothetical protein FISHEDRAFT_74954 [Fistulina hepatica ATCC 64428]